MKNKKIIKDNKRIVYIYKLIYILKSMRNKVMALYYNSSLYRYLGTEKTAEKII